MTREFAQHAAAAFLRDAVWSETTQPPRGFILGKTLP